MADSFEPESNPTPSPKPNSSDSFVADSFIPDGVSDKDAERIKRIGSAMDTFAQMAGGIGLTAAAAPGIAATGPWAPVAGAAVFGAGASLGKGGSNIIKKLLDIPNPETRGQVLDMLESFFGNTTGAMAGAGTAAGLASLAERQAIMQPGVASTLSNLAKDTSSSKFPFVPGEPASPASPNASLIKEGQQSKLKLAAEREQAAKDIGGPISADQVYGMPAPGFSRPEDVAAMNAYRESQKQFIANKLDDFRLAHDAPIFNTQKAMNEGLGRFEGIHAGYEKNVKEAVNKARALSGDKTFFNTDPVLNLLDESLSQFGKSGEVGVTAMQRMRDELFRMTKAQSSFVQKGGEIPSLQELQRRLNYFGEAKFVTGPADARSEWAFKGLSPDGAPIIELVKRINIRKGKLEARNPVGGYMPGSQVYDPNAEAFAAVGNSNLRQTPIPGSQTMAGLPPVPGGEVSRGVSLQFLDKATQKAQDFWKQKGDNGGPVEAAWGRIQHALRLARDEAASEVLALRGKTAEAAQLRSARDLYAKTIEGFEDIKSALEKDPTNYVAALMDAKNPKVTIDRINFMSKYDPDTIKLLRGGFLDSLAIGPSGERVPGPQIEKNLAKTDPKILRAMFGVRGVQDLKKIVNYAKIIDATPMSGSFQKNQPGLEALSSTRRLFIGGADFMRGLLSREARPQDYMNNRIYEYMVAPKEVSGPIRASMYPQFQEMVRNPYKGYVNPKPDLNKP